jgi:ribonuclease G
MKSRKHQNTVYKAMKQALRRDRARTNVLQISELGLMEMTRQRQEESLLSKMYSDCPYCKGHGSVKSPLALSADIQRQIGAVMRKGSQEGRDVNLQVIVAPSVLDRLRKEDEAFLVELQRRYTGRLTFKSELHRHPESFCIVDGDTAKVLYSVGDSKSV